MCETYFYSYLDNDIEVPSDKRRLSISTVNRQMYKDKMHICAVSLSRRRGGTVLKNDCIQKIGEEEYVKEVTRYALLSKTHVVF